MMASWRYLLAWEAISFWSTSRALPEVERMWRRMSARAALAVSAISSSERMEPVMVSSRALSGVRARNRGRRQLRSSSPSQ